VGDPGSDVDRLAFHELQFHTADPAVYRSTRDDEERREGVGLHLRVLVHVLARFDLEPAGTKALLVVEEGRVAAMQHAAGALVAEADDLGEAAGPEVEGEADPVVEDLGRDLEAVHEAEVEGRNVAHSRPSRRRQRIELALVHLAERLAIGDVVERGLGREVGVQRDVGKLGAVGATGDRNVPLLFIDADTEGDRSFGERVAPEVVHESLQHLLHRLAGGSSGALRALARR
jgi:hypothetical protein